MGKGFPDGAAHRSPRQSSSEIRQPPFSGGVDESSMPQPIFAHRHTSTSTKGTAELPYAGLGAEPTVLLVEDHDDTREFMRVLFETAGFVVTDRQSGTGAVDAIVRTRPDAVILNGFLRGEDGWSICHKLRHAEDPTICDTPVIFISTARGNDETRAFTAGCDVFVLKPFDVDKLLASVTGLIVRRRTIH
jgi:CheY-like chemotaxis protein